MPLYSEDFPGGFEVTVDHIGMGWAHIPDSVTDQLTSKGYTITADTEGYVFAVGLYLDEATCAALNDMLQTAGENDKLGVTNGWENAILYILEGEYDGEPVTFYCFVTIVVDEEGTTWYYWEVTWATADDPD